MDRELSTRTRIASRLRGWLPGVLAIALAGAGLVWAIGLLEPTLKRDEIRTGRVERGPIEAVITGSGTVLPAAEQVVSSPIEARVIRVLRRPGAVLVAGEAILELDVSAPQLELERLEGELARNAAQRDELRLELEESLLDLDSQREIKALDVEEQEYLLVQRRELFEQGLVAESLLRQTETRVKRSRIELRALGDSIAKARDVATARLESLEASRRTLERERTQTRDRLERATTRTERDGVLTWVVSEEGAMVGRGEVIARIADLDLFRVEGVVSDVHASRLRTGQTVRVPIQGGTVLDGRIDRILPEIESGTVLFEVALDEPGHADLRANLRGDVLVVTESKPSVLTVKKGPYANGTGEREVFVVDDEAAVRRAVRFGLAGHERFEVLEGLEEGEEIILTDVADYLHLERVRLH